MLKKWATLWRWISLVALLQLLSGHGAALAQADCVGGSWLNQRTGQNVRAGLGLPEPGASVVYDNLDQNGKLILPKCAYAVGNVRIPVFMVNWADFNPQTSLSNENNPQSTLRAGYVRSTPQELGSYLQTNLTDYWRNVTGGKLNLSFDTYGWIDSSAPGAYLKSRKSYLYNSNPAASQPYWYCDRNAMFRDVVKDAATWHGLDLNQYDVDGNGMVDGAMLVYAGGAGLCNGTNLSWLNAQYTPNPAGFNWQSALPDLFDAADPNRAQFANHNQILHLYNNVPERDSLAPNQFTRIGTWAHELGHMLWGFPDLYLNRFNISVWALAGNSHAIPSHPAAFEKWMYGQLITPTDITSNGSYVLQANEIADGSDHNQGTYLYRIPLDNPSHFLTVEARWFDADGNTGTRWAGANGRESGLVILEHRHDASYFGGTPVMLYRYVPERDGSYNPLRDQNAAFKPGDVFQRCLFDKCITLTPTTGPGATFGFDVNVSPVDPQLLASNGLRFLHPAQPSNFILNSTDKIRWSSLLDASDTIKIELSRDGGSTWETLAGSVANTGLYHWPVKGAASDAVKLRLTSNSNPSVSVTSSVARILVPAISWITPGTNQISQPNKLLPLRWNTNLPSTDFAAIDISRDGGSTWTTLFGAVRNNGAFDWHISGSMGQQLRFRIKSAYYPSAVATSAIVTLATPPVGVTSPNSSLTWLEGSTQSISWNSSFFTSESVLLELSRDSGNTWELINSGTANNGRYDWKVAGITNNGRIRISASNNPANFDTSDIDFKIIAPTLGLSQPNLTGSSWTVGTSMFIAWSNNFPATATMKVELSRDDGANWSILNQAAPNANSYNIKGYSWTVDGGATSTARIRITSNDFPALSVTGAPFTIFVPTLAVTSQASSSSYPIGASMPITWSSNLSSSTSVNIEFSADDGSTWRTLVAQYPNTGNWSWRIDGSATANGRIRVSSVGSSAQGISQASFTLFAPQISVTAPVAGATWVLGEQQTIRWSSNPASQRFGRGGTVT